MEHSTRHMAARMNQRGIPRDFVDLALEYGEIDQDKRVLNRKCLQRILDDLRSTTRKVIRALDKGGVVVVEANGHLLTTYRAGRRRRS
jgi:hypothetical protein